MKTPIVTLFRTTAYTLLLSLQTRLHLRQAPLQPLSDDECRVLAARSVC